MAYYLQFVLYFMLFAAGVACGVIHERYRVSHHRARVRRL